MKKLISIITLIITILLPQAALAKDFVMTYLYGGTTATYLNYVERTGQILDEVSPDYFEIDSQGNLYMPKISRDFIRQMKEQGIRVVPFISNHWDRPLGIKALENTEALTDQLARAVRDYDLDGVNVDIENVTDIHREAFTHFVRRLRDKLPDKIIAVAVAANPRGWQTGWHGSYDYAALAEISDYLLIMAYDESYFGGPSGPVASFDFAEKSIQYALQFAPPEKLVLGVPFYGRYWQSDKGGYGITTMDIAHLLENYPYEYSYFDEYGIQSAQATVTIGPDDPQPTLWGGTTLTDGIYQIWYETPQTLASKIRLARDYGLKGTGSWALGQEIPEIWQTYASNLPGLTLPEPEFPHLPQLPEPEPEPDNEPEPDSEPEPEIGPESPEPALPAFSDTAGHWAEAAIADVYQLGWMKGISASQFAPERSLTRAEAVTIFSRAADFPLEDNGIIFPDTVGHWAEKEISAARFYGLAQGQSNGNFAPNRPISREEFAVLADRVFELATTIDFNNNVFRDFEQERHQWSYNSVIKLYENEILTGFPDGTFRPLQAITRAEAATIFSRLAIYGIKDLQSEHKKNISLNGDPIFPR
ncbi:MAG: S-layer homology domain-containing protein [Clostridiales bacterium]|jgi:spore germination protein YaaH|nr:S-layer homology domain-containing protein [Clostridiales bacterium]MDR2713545.1 S-layer homology domain-containing protein [Clostridiales bacterium]